MAFVLLLLFSAILGAQSVASVNTLPPPTPYEERTVAYEWYKFFDVPDPNTGKLGTWWNKRNEMYGEYGVVRDEYPMVFWFEDLRYPGSFSCSAMARLKVTGRNLQEFNISDTNPKPQFVPLLNPTAAPTGDVKINYYMQYVTEEEWPWPEYDGYQSNWTGTVELDRAAAQRVLGYDGVTPFDSWWATNKDAVEAAWMDWLDYEGNTRLDIYNMNGWFLEIASVSLNAYYEGVDPIFEYVMDVEVLSWSGIEVLFARWFRDSFMPQYEGYYEDLHFNAYITEWGTNVDLDTGVMWGLWAYSLKGPAAWDFEAMHGDWLPLSPQHPKSDFDPYVMPNGTYWEYYSLSPGNKFYGQWYPYDYTPWAWNLREGETLTFTLPSGPVPGYLHGGDLHYGSAETLNVTEVLGTLDLGYMEPNIVTEYWYDENGTAHEIPPPFPTSGPGSVSYDPVERVLNFTGPLDLYNWSENTMLGIDDPNTGLASNWDRMGVLPWSSPLIEFNVENTQPGTNVEVSIPVAEVALTFDSVTDGGTTEATVSSAGPSPPTGFKLGEPPMYYDITTTATFTDTIQISITYDESKFTNETNLKLMQWDEAVQEWQDVTVSLDTVNNIIYGQVTSLSLFAVMEPIPPVPYIPATVDIDPDTLNLKSNGEFITTYIELPNGYDVADIDLFTVYVDGIPAITDPQYSFVTDPNSYLMDHDGDGILERMVKFDRATVKDLLTGIIDYEGGVKFYDLLLAVTGEVAGTPFQGSDTIVVIYKGS